MSRTFVLHDESINTQGFRMLTTGADLTEFRKNPVMLLNHNDWSMPIGRWENIRVEGKQIVADAIFDEKDPQAKMVADKVERDFIRAASIGAWLPKGPLEEFDPLTGKKLYTFSEWVVREASIVTIPSNHNALAFYDRETGKLVDNSEVLKLFDTIQKPNELSIEKNRMKEVAKLLKLADTATEPDVTAAVQALMGDLDRLAVENQELKDSIEATEKAAKQQKLNEAATLVDSAIKDGRIDAKAKDSYLKLFDSDFEAAKTALEAIPLRKSVTGEIEKGKNRDNAELADLQKATWDELDRQGKLAVLKDKYPDLYEQKFEQRFKVKPKN